MSQQMTIGAKTPAIFVVPRGWMRNNNTKMAHETPTMVPLEISSLTISRLEGVRENRSFRQNLTLG